MMKSLAISTMDCGPMSVWSGRVFLCALAPPNLSDTEGAEEGLEGVCGHLLALYKSAKHQKQP